MMTPKENMCPLKVYPKYEHSLEKEKVSTCLHVPRQRTNTFSEHLLATSYNGIAKPADLLAVISSQIP